ncbi:hypothetical protein LINPERPRIM_LOCUS26749 [Linum perenne]
MKLGLGLYILEKRSVDNVMVSKGSGVFISTYWKGKSYNYKYVVFSCELIYRAQNNRTWFSFSIVSRSSFHNDTSGFTVLLPSPFEYGDSQDTDMHIVLQVPVAKNDLCRDIIAVLDPQDSDEWHPELWSLLLINGGYLPGFVAGIG